MNLAQQQKKQNPEKLKEIVRILNTDIPGTAKIYYGLTRIKGISWLLSNVICHILKIDKLELAYMQIYLSAFARLLTK